MAGFYMPVTASAASLSFDRTSGAYTVGSTIVTTITVGSSDAAVNAVSGTVSFPSDTLEVVSISKSRSLVSLWVVEPTFSNSAGTVTFEGIILNPGYTGQGGAVLTVTFRVKAAGTAALRFGSASVLANDGLGTELLQSRGSASYQLTVATPAVAVQSDEPSAPVPVAVEQTGVATLPEMVSASHVVDSWSKETTGTFNFSFSEAVTAMRLLVDEQPDSVPTVVYMPPISSRTIEDLTSGISYLHVQYKTAAGWGEVLHYKLQIDTTLPRDLVVTDLGDDIFGFTAADDLSGVVRYELHIDGGELVTIDASRPIYKFTGLSQGEHVLLIKAIDRAGNVLSQNKTVTITGQVTTAPTGDEAKTVAQSVWGTTLTLSSGVVMAAMLIVAIPGLVLLVLTGWLLVWSWRTFKDFKTRLHTEITEARMMVFKSFALLKADLEVDVTALQKAGKKRKLTREEIKILKRLQANIAVTESLITKEVTDIDTTAGG